VPFRTKVHTKRSGMDHTVFPAMACLQVKLCVAISAVNALENGMVFKGALQMSRFTLLYFAHPENDCRYLTCWFILTLPSSKVKVNGHRMQRMFDDS